MNAYMKRGDSDFFAIDLHYTLNLLTGKIFYKNIQPMFFVGNEIEPMQIDEVKEDYCFSSHDMVNINHSDENFSRLHFHPDEEARWTIAGTGFFFIPLGRLLIKVEVEKGDFLIIKADVNHWYEFLEENNNIHSLIRFFAQNNGRETNYINGILKIFN